jgi:hypothetical protein
VYGRNGPEADETGRSADIEAVQVRSNATMPMDSSRKPYVRIGAGYITGIRLRTGAGPDEGKRRAGRGACGRVFVATGDTFPVGSHVEFDLNVPEQGGFHATGITEYTGDGSETDGAPGMGICLFEVTRRGPRDEESTNEDLSQTDQQEGADHAAGEAQNHDLFPEYGEIEEFLTGMLDMKVSVKEGAPVDAARDKPAVIAVFSGENGQIEILCVCDTNSAVSIGAALAVIPVEDAREAAASGDVPQNILDNFKEVMNVSATLYNKGERPPVSLAAIHITSDEPPEDVLSLLEKAAMRKDVIISITNYGDCAMSILAADRR